MSAPNRKCNRHRTGTLPGRPVTFSPQCPECQRQKAAGDLTGNEPRPTVGTRAYNQAAWNLRQQKAKGKELAKKRRVIS